MSTTTAKDPHTALYVTVVRTEKFTRYGVTRRGTLYETWTYPDFRPDVHAVNCIAVRELPADDPATWAIAAAMDGALISL